jgi:hypothetical protein
MQTRSSHAACSVDVIDDKDLQIISPPSKVSRKRKASQLTNNDHTAEEESPHKRRRTKKVKSSAKSEELNNVSLTLEPSSSELESPLAEPATLFECSVCYEHIKEQGVIDCCNHEFCFQCISKWSKDSNECPICKQRFNTIRKKMTETGKFLSRPRRVPQRNFRAEPQTAPVFPMLLLLRELVTSPYGNNNNRLGPLLTLLARVQQTRTSQPPQTIDLREGSDAENPLIITDDDE